MVVVPDDPPARLLPATHDGLRVLEVKQWRRLRQVGGQLLAAAVRVRRPARAEILGSRFEQVRHGLRRPVV